MYVPPLLVLSVSVSPDFPVPTPLPLFCRVIPVEGIFKAGSQAGSCVRPLLPLVLLVTVFTPLFALVEGLFLTKKRVMAAIPRLPAVPLTVLSCVRVGFRLSSAKVSMRFNRICRMRSFSTPGALALRALRVPVGLNTEMKENIRIQTEVVKRNQYTVHNYWKRN